MSKCRGGVPEARSPTKEWAACEKRVQLPVAQIDLRKSSVSGASPRSTRATLHTLTVYRRCTWIRRLLCSRRRRVARTRLQRLMTMAGSIAVVPYDEAWIGRFDALKARVNSAMGALARRIEHVGSTAVPGLPAKPVIDIDVVIEREDQLEEVIKRLAAIGYRFRGDLGITGRYAFRSPAGSPDHHLYVCGEDSVALHRHLALRDYLRRHPEEAAAYGKLKQRLAQEHPFDRSAYTDGKTRWIEKALQHALPKIGGVPVCGGRPGTSSTSGPHCGSSRRSR